MSLREEDRQKNNCPSRGLGLAATAIGVGVGAALYYFFSKRPENPDEEGSTSGWTCEQPHAFNLFNEDEESDASMENQCDSPNNSMADSEYITISETITTDTSIHVTESSINSSPSLEQFDDSYIEVIPSSDEDLDAFSVEDFVVSSDNVEIDAPEHEWDDEWDVTDSSMGVPEDMLFRELSPLIWSLFSARGSRNNRSGVRTRERSWSLEECSICFEIMLKDQDLTKLPCAHNFHSSCLAPWLAEQQTCPNCRKAAE